MADLLIELFSEEIPARMQHAAAEGFLKLVTDGLSKNGLTITESRFYYTPRRLTVFLSGIPETRESRFEEIKGPRVDASEQAIQGFLRKSGCIDLSACITKKIDGIDYYFVEKTKVGGPTIESLSPIILTAIQNLAWPKSMRWGNGTFRWARPLHSILALFDGQVINGTLDLGGGMDIPFGNTTQGHRFLSNGKRFPVENFADYQKKLMAAHVILDQTERRTKIWESAQKTAQESRYTLKPDEKLLTEIVGLVEWPMPFMGSFDPSFLNIPPEVISTSMRENQRYFSVLDTNGKLTNRFVTLANITPDDGGKTIIYGNEKVLRARLSDAQFFWEQDLKNKLDNYTLRLEKIRFHEKLGTVAQKVERIEKLAARIAHDIDADQQKAIRAAHLSKTDLVTGMVREFPELQGIMGGYYARQSGESDAVASAIATHYSPLGPNDSVPTAPISIAVALADKIDTLVGFFSINEKPTGSKDPFALRRAALGILRLIVENNLSVSLRSLVDFSALLYGTKPPLDIPSFLSDRFRIVLIDRGFPQKIVNSILIKNSIDDAVDLQNRVAAVSQFIKMPEGSNLLALIRRARNILDSAKSNLVDAIQPDLFTTPEEKTLYAALSTVKETVQAHINAGRYTDAMKIAATLYPTVNAFFDGVMIMDTNTDLRANRLALSGAVAALVSDLADFSQLD